MFHVNHHISSWSLMEENVRVYWSLWFSTLFWVFMHDQHKTSRIKQKVISDIYLCSIKKKLLKSILCEVHCSFRQKEEILLISSELHISDYLCHLTALAVTLTVKAQVVICSEITPRSSAPSQGDAVLWP